MTVAANKIVLTSPGRVQRLAPVATRLLLYVVVLLCAVIFAVPFYWMIRTAVMPSTQIFVYPPEWIPESLHFETFGIPFSMFPFGRWLFNSATISVLSAIGVIVSASIVGFGFARLRMPFREPLFIVMLATMMLPDQVRLVPTYLLFVKLGWGNTFLPLVVPMWLAPAFYVFLMRQFFMTIPTEMDDAAYIDGCSPIGVYWRIALPLSLPAIGVAAIYAFTYSWNDFLNPLIYLQKIDIYTVAVGLRLLQNETSTLIQATMAGALVSALPAIILFFVAQRYFVQGIVITGIKG